LTGGSATLCPVTDGADSIISRIFEEAAADEHAKLVSSRIKALWDAGEWTPEAIQAELNKIEREALSMSTP
jgi:hypothetical protein